MAKTDLTAQRLRELLHYDPATGIFTRIAHTYGGRGAAKIGAIVGSVRSNGYRMITLSVWRYHAHRLACLYMTGEWPRGVVDHINGVKDDNRWCNLRDVTSQANTQNIRKANACNKLGVLGVCQKHGKGSFLAAIRADGRLHNLGSFDTAEEAHAAYLEAKRRFHVGCTI